MESSADSGICGEYTQCWNRCVDHGSIQDLHAESTIGSSSSLVVCPSRSHDDTRQAALHDLSHRQSCQHRGSVGDRYLRLPVPQGTALFRWCEQNESRLSLHHFHSNNPLAIGGETWFVD